MAIQVNKRILKALLSSQCLRAIHQQLESSVHLEVERV